MINENIHINKVLDNVVRISRTKNSATFKIICSCGDDDHSVIFEFEKYKDKYNLFNIIIYGTIDSYDEFEYEELPWYIKLYNIVKSRIKKAIQIITKGYITGSVELSMLNEDQIDSFMYMINENYRKMKNPSRKKEQCTKI